MNSYKILKIEGTRITVEWTINGVKSTDVLDGRHLLYVAEYVEAKNADGQVELVLKDDAREDTLESELMRQLTIMVADANKTVPAIEQAQGLVGVVNVLEPAVTE
jgi:hypothetical protein